MKNIKKIALKRIFYLYEKAKEIYEKDRDLSKRYIEILYNIKKKASIKNIRLNFCKRCFSILIPGKTLDIRIRGGKIIYRCKNCGLVKRFIIKRKSGRLP